MSLSHPHATDQNWHLTSPPFRKLVELIENETKLAHTAAVLWAEDLVYHGSNIQKIALALRNEYQLTIPADHILHIQSAAEATKGKVFSHG